MIQWAGWGVAIMGSTISAVKEIAALAPVTNDQDAVAWAIENYVLKLNKWDYLIVYLEEKEETEKVLHLSDDESTKVEETVKRPAATLNDKEEQKITDMEAYYQDLKAQIAATHQPVSTVAQEEPEEPLVKKS